MAGTDVFANYMAELDDNLDPSMIRLVLEKLQAMLASAEAMHDRVVYLETMAGHVPEFRDHAAPVADPFTGLQRTACIEKGLIGAWEAGDVKAMDLAKLAHSVEGLGNFTDALFETPEDHSHPVWRDAFETPLKPISIDLEFLTRHGPNELAKSKVSTLISNWIESMKPPRPLPSFGFRGDSMKKLPPDLLESSLPEETVCRLIDELSAMRSGFPGDRMQKALERVPWQEFKCIVGNSGTWLDFLNQAELLLAENFDDEEITELSSWINAEAQNAEDHSKALRLFEILLRWIDIDCG
jgi:hypothetical protein